jgi:ABC-type glutathione transport system ATPase component
MSSPVIDLIEVSKSYTTGPVWSRRAVDALKPTSLQLRRGEMLAVVGESGSGKTTLARICLGLVKPTTGQLAFAGAPFPRNARALRGKLAAVLQNPAASLNPRLRVGTSIAEPMALAGIGDRASRRREVHALLEQVGLSSDFAQRFPGELSGGQRQRAAIARALSTSPELVVFDEAVSALDVSVQSQVLNLVGDLQERIGFAALFITHDLAVARYCSDSVLVMRDGRVEDHLAARALYVGSDNPYVWQLQVASGLLGP